MDVTLCHMLGFPQEAIDFLAEADRKIEDNTVSRTQMLWAEDDYMSGGIAHLEHLAAIAEETGIHRYTLDMVFLLRCASRFLEKYWTLGYSDELFYDSMGDLTCKLHECRQLYGVWGTFVLHWFRGFFTCDRFKLGRLQYERTHWTLGDYHDLIRSGESMLKCHIPSGSPCRREDVLDSLRRAYEFFHPQGDLKVMCQSWMLYPPHFPLFPEGGNLAKFHTLFSIVDEVEHGNVDFWRIFGRYPSDSFAGIPEDNALQKNFARWLRDGNSMGVGVGLLVYDGERIVNM